MATATATLPAQTELRGLWSWLTTVDHKRIGILYGISALAFFIIGGIEALLIRAQLATSDGTVLSADAYNQLFTMHGTTMIFLVVMPASAAFGNYLIPLLIGARDVAFPRLNALSYWIFLAGGVFLNSAFFLGGGPDGGWFGYAPLSGQDTAAVRMDFWAIGLVVLGVASLLGSINFITTIFTMRAPGMGFFRMPVFVWMQLVVAFLLLFALPIITIGLFQLIFDRNFGTVFYQAAAGGDPVLWQHMFWLFGHPEVYVLILPAMGIVSEVLPVFSRKPLFGYAFVVFAGASIALLGFGVWAHHMFTVGLGPVAEAAFALSTMTIAVPTGVKIFNWLATVWGGSVRLKTPMLFSLGFIAMFTIGGLSGVTHSVVPADSQQTDSYYVVAHFHYVLFGGAIFGLFSGVYYWWPKLTGRVLGESLGKLHFWLMLIGFNLAFAPMHILGLNGQPRRTYTYPSGMGWSFWNLVSTIGAFTIALSILVFLINIVRSRRGPSGGPDPWDGRTLEWSIPSPPPAHNFDEVPTVRAIDDFWYRKYSLSEDDYAVPIVTGASVGVEAPPEHEAEHPIHMPSPSYYPLIVGIGILLVAYGLTFNPIGFALAGLGVVGVLWGLFGWSLEPIDHP